MKIAAVIPAYNEAAAVTRTVLNLKPHVQLIIVVDDGSTDGTAELAGRAGARVVRHLINRGQGAALETGTRLALQNGADIVVHFDADGQHDAKDISNIIAPIAEGRADVVLGSRFLGQAINLPLTRHLVLRLAVLFTRVFSGLKLSDAHNGFRAFSREAAAKIRLHHDDMAHASEILDIIAENNMKYVEIPVTVHYTPYTLKRGQGSWNSFQIVKKLIIEKFFHNS